MKNFLKSFAAIAAGFAAQSASAAITNTPLEQSKSQDVSSAANSQGSGAVAVRTDEGDIFNFVMKRSMETGQVMAYHSSHASHSSHRSHYSSR